MTKLSVNINKVALLRNARHLDLPNLVQFAIDCEKYGADGITVHPRPDERHIRYSDIPALKEVVTTEFNIEGNPTQDFIDLVLANKPHQVTLVPDDPNQLTSDHGWDTIKHLAYLTEIISTFKKEGIRVSIFIDPELEMIENAAKTGADRIELYTEPYASGFEANAKKAVAKYVEASNLAEKLNMGINAGHDLNLKNLKFLKQNISQLAEVSIGHALVADALYYGIQNTIGMYKRLLV
ncbi:MAG: pyridoxine 5'-phosphate synthase [Bacteroidetes bacterium]|nr:pyridoxine 5'-phosphate synthase [Bacteroidota bacterium]